MLSGKYRFGQISKNKQHKGIVICLESEFRAKFQKFNKKLVFLKSLYICPFI